jgi:transposase-like protein
MSTKRKQYSAKFKFKVALEAVKEQKTISQIASQHNLHPTQIRNWKKRLISEGGSLFEQKTTAQQEAQHQAQEVALYEQIGRLKMELEWLKKKVN